MSQFRGRPPKNKQNLDDSCWAAALDSFSRVTRHVPVQRENDLIATYGVGATGGLNSVNLGALRIALSIHGVQVDLEPYLTMPYSIEDRLEKSHVVLARHLGGTDWHAWLVYGCDSTFVYYMDPRDGKYHSMTWAGSSFSSSQGYYLFWRP